jgi:hypothetical protein
LDKKFIILAGIIPTEPKCCFPEPPQSGGVCTPPSNKKPSNLRFKVFGTTGFGNFVSAEIL